MDKLRFSYTVLPWLAFQYAGIHCIVEVIFPSLRSPDFNHWEIDEDSGPYIKVAGWRKALRPPQVIARGYMSDRAACVVALVVGTECVLIGVFGIHHFVGVPAALPDVFSEF